MIGRLLRASRSVVLSVLGNATRRHAVLLDRSARDESALLDVRAPYRVDGETLRAQVVAPGKGELALGVRGYRGSFPGDPLFTGSARACGPRATVTLALDEGTVRLDGAAWGPLLPIEGRRFRLDFTWTGGGATRTRTTGHYRPGAAGPADASYYQGGTYTDHEATEQDEAQQVLALTRRLGAASPVLEVGCATGGTLKALREQGLHAVGVDISPWAVDRARARLDDDAAFVCDVENDTFPDGVTSHVPYETIVLWAVLEHFRAPFETLEKLNALAAPGALLIVNTTNADSLTHFLFGSDWEGHFDPTHYGVDRVSVSSVRARLPELGWRLVHLETTAVWAGGADPTQAVLRDTFAHDARFRRLLAEREVGDFLIFAARRTGEESS